MEQELVFMTIKEPYHIETDKNLEYEGPSAPLSPPQQQQQGMIIMTQCVK